MATITVDPISSPRIITVLSPDTSITIQALYDLLRAWEQAPQHLDYDYIVSAGGKESLGGGKLVGITLTLQNAKLAFEARGGPSFEQCTVDGGNLVAVDSGGTPFSPIEPTAYTQVVIAQSTSAALIDEATLASDVAAIKAKTDALPDGVKRGVALSKFTFALVASADHFTPKTGASPVVKVSKDGSAFATSTNAAVEVGSGVYYVDLTATEMDAGIVTLYITGTGADPRAVTIVTSG